MGSRDGNLEPNPARPAGPAGTAPPAGTALWRWLVPALLVVAWLGLGGGLGPLAGKLGDVAESGSAAYLPANAEATEVIELNERFGAEEALPGILVYSRDGGLRPADEAAINRDIQAIQRELGAELTEPPVGPFRSEDGEAAQVVVLFAGSDMFKIAPLVEELRELVRPADGLTANVAGPAGVQADLDAALGAIDLMLILVTTAVILVILIVVYRSPLLPFLVLAVAGTALGVANGLIYLLADAGLLTMGSEAQGILSVLVLGCATDYALLLVARFREELRRHESSYDAMRVAWRNSFEPIAASAGTVALGMLCLLISDLGLNKGLGPAAAIGVTCAMIAMLTFMPALLVLLGRAAFWPRRPAFHPATTLGVSAGAPGTATGEHLGVWARVAKLVDRAPRLLWIGTAAVLAVLALGVLRLDADGIPESDMIIADNVDSKLGQQALADHFPAGSGNPAIVITRAGVVEEVTRAARGVDGVADVAPFTAGGSGPRVVDGLARVDVTLDSAPDSDEALATVRALRDAVHQVPDADARVGGYSAVELDFNTAAERDRVVIPVLLAVVFVLVALLLRAVVAPLLLIGTVVLSFLAAIGVSTFVFQNVFGFAGVDSTFPLHAFVFLVALGVDYNIFLMSRVREESVRGGTRRGTLTGLMVTGGVITSAGVVLAATFAALAVIPLVLMVELAFTVAFGVLLDTLIVRSLLVPALVVDTGRGVWWPSRLARRRDDLPTEGGEAPVAEDKPDTKVPVAAKS
jgi:putative drug exporter of the RND superfamily